MVFVYYDRVVWLVNLVVGLVMFKVGWLSFRWYGFLIGLGVAVAVYVSLRLARRFKVKEGEVWDGMVWVLGGGIMGARIYHVLDWWQYYIVHPGEILAFWHGGMGIYGGIVGGLIGLWWYSRKRGKSLLRLADLAVIGLPLGQAIGRWGNFINQELYGKPTNLPWGIYIRPENRLLSVMEFAKFHPLFLYESLWSLVVFFILLRLVKRQKRQRGEIFFSYLGLYSFGRFWLEWLRIESWLIGGVNVAQMISLGLVMIVVGWKIMKKITA